MNCKRVYYHICDKLDADIHSPRCRQIKKHLKTCPDCAAYLDSLKKTVSLYRNLRVPAVPFSVHNQLLKSINAIWAMPAAARTRAPKRKGR